MVGSGFPKRIGGTESEGRWVRELSEAGGLVSYGN